MYTLQALWTMAREGLNVTTVVFANHGYAVLKPSSVRFLIWGKEIQERGPWICSKSAAQISIGCSWRKEWEFPARGSIRWKPYGKRYGQDCDGRQLEVPTGKNS